ncbi:phosphotransferase [Candidatus Poribacteria bacterium]|nr:phosphotransferase [Candidatus Poribacteria bacterium]MBT7803842.1 phosphotransferase [Candidatus Poribacteria bacterium]
MSASYAPSAKPSAPTCKPTRSGCGTVSAGLRATRATRSYRRSTTRPTKGSGSLTMLVKRFHTPGEREAAHYAHLHAHGAPIPDLYLAETDATGREILFLEFLEAIVDLDPMAGFLSNAVNFGKFLTAAARLNAIRPSQAYASILRPRNLGGTWEEARGSLTALVQLAAAGSLGDAVRRTVSEMAPGSLVALSHRLEARLAEMPVGLVHNDHDSANTGLRRATGELLIFDLEFVGIGPRFTDVAGALGETDAEQPRCLPRSALAAQYLAAYALAGGDAPSVDTLLGETRDLLMAGTLRMLGWSIGRALDGVVDWTEDRDDGRREARAGLLADLQRLVDYAE